MEKDVLEELFRDPPGPIAACRELLLSSDPGCQAVPYHLNAWKSKLGHDPDFQAVVDAYPGSLTRGQVAHLSAMAAEEQTAASMRRLFIATMIWGYGSVGYGAYRTRRILEDKQLSSTLQSTYELIGEGRLLQAYEQFHITQCGPAFFSKYFYFAGLGCHPELLPLILDSRVAQSLSLLFGGDLKKVASVGWNNGRVAYVGRFPEGYVRYVRAVNGWARQLGCRPDSIEMLLFDPPAGFRG